MCHEHRKDVCCQAEIVFFLKTSQVIVGVVLIVPFVYFRFVSFFLTILFLICTT